MINDVFKVIILIVTTNSCYGEYKNMYQIYNFSEFAENNINTSLVFKNEDTISSRKVTFISHKKRLLIQTERIKGLVKWSNVKNISYKESLKTKGLLIIKILNNSDRKNGIEKEINFGLINITQWNILKEKYSDDLVFIN